MAECIGSQSCLCCGIPLTPDEIGLTKKLVNRGCTEFRCYHCLAKQFQVTVDDLQRKVQEFREMGCTLFE
nr:hypothetical protein [Clostridia bacterium]